MKTDLLLLVFLVSVIPSSAQDKKNIDSASLLPVKVQRISGGIVLDGIPDEPAWQQVKSFSLVMFSPNYGAVPVRKTEVKFACDQEYFYLSGRLSHTDLKNIRAVGKKRDYDSPSSDWFGFILDSFNDRENALTFHTNPNGVRTDGTLKNDAVDLDNDLSFNWNTFWDVSTSVSEEGWTAEFRIPFNSLRFQNIDGKTIMGILIWRYDASGNEMYTWPVVSSQFSSAFWKPSQCGLIEFEGIEPVTVLYTAPYVTAGLGQTNELSSSGTEYTSKTKIKHEAGLDLKYNFTPNLTADATVNTDFAQVEADDEKINLTRYSLYFPEKRIFFLEKADIFDFSFLDGNNLFYSRRIGLYDGNPVRIYGGLRLTGRMGEWDIGFLNMQTAPVDENPGENFGVIRTRKKIFNENSYAGGIFTSRLRNDGGYNLAYGLDGQFRIAGEDYLVMKWAQSFEKDSLKKIPDMAPSRVMLEWQRRSQTGFGYDFIYSWSGKSFNPGIGFETRDNYHGPKIILKYGWLPGSSSFLRYHKISATGYFYGNTVTHEDETGAGILQWNYETKTGYWGNAAINWYRENLQEELILGNNQASVPRGKYSFVFFSGQYATSYAADFSATVSAEAGKFYDGWKLSLSLEPKLKIGSNFDIGLTYDLDYVDFSSRSMNFTNHIAGFKSLMTLSTVTSLSAFVQYNTAVERIITNIRFRYNPGEGNDFYIVYDESMNLRLDREYPPLPRRDAGTILLKYTHTLRF